MDRGHTHCSKPPKPTSSLPHETPEHLNSVIKQHANLKNDHAILSLYPHGISIPLTQHLLPLSRRLGAVERGKKIHSLIWNSGFDSDVRVGTALIDFYCKCGLTDGEIFQKLVELESMNPGNYVLLSNIYAEAGLWFEVRKIRKLLREKGLKKHPGTSWIVIKSQVHSFIASDTSHPDSYRIYACLNSLSALTKEIGYIPDLQWVLHEEN